MQSRIASWYVQLGSLSNGHTNQGLGCAIDGVNTTEKSLAVNGRTSREKITKDQPNLAEAIDKGLVWQVIDASAEEMYGKELPNLVQRARQAVGQAQQAETLLQQCLNIRDLASQKEAAGAVADFGEIREIVLQSQPPNPKDIPKACDWVQYYAGSQGEFLNELVDFDAVCVPAGRTLSADHLQCYTELKLEAHELCPDFVVGSIKCHLDCPEKKVVDGVSTFVKDSMVKSLGGKKKADMIAANALMREFKQEVVKKMNLQPQSMQYIEWTGKSDCITARIVHELPVVSRFQGMSVTEALELTWSDMCQALEIRATNPFHTEKPTPKTENKAAPKAQMGLVKYDARGQAVGLQYQNLVSQGFVVDACVENKDGDLFA